ncbi:---NA---, partial [Pelobates cultripes]
MAAQRRPQERTAHSKPSSPHQGNLDWLCKRFWDMLHSRGMTYYHEETMVSSWIRPAARCSHYRRKLQAFNAAIRQRRFQKSLRRERAPCHPNASSFLLTHKSRPTIQAPQACTNIRRSTIQLTTANAAT